MAPAWRQIEEVTRLEHPFLCGFELRKQLEWRTVNQGRITRWRNPPAATPACLKQEDVIGIDMRTHPPAIACVAHHQVIESGIRKKSEASKELMGGIQVPVHAIDQDRPARAPGRGQVIEWAMLQSPSTLATGREP